MELTGVQVDRAAGVLLGLAAGDALGAGYEFGPPLGDDAEVGMVGGGVFHWAPGEWTDDTSMALCIAEVAATGQPVHEGAGLDAVGQRFVAWSRSDIKDIGSQTGAVLSGMPVDVAAAALAAKAQQVHERHKRSGGSGSLMRTAPVALANLDDEQRLVEAAQAISALTHFDPEAGEACALWCLGIRHAVLHGTFDGVRLGLDLLPASRAKVWEQRLDDAEQRESSSFRNNGWVVEALQGAWSAVVRTPVPPTETASGSHPALHLQHGLEAAVRGGGDTDTVAAIAGGLLGARWGASALPVAWQRALHGWPGLRARDLVRLGVRTARWGRNDVAGWPGEPVMAYGSWGDRSALARHPHDSGVWLGGSDAVGRPPDGVDAVVSLCRLGAAEAPARGVAAADHVEVWLVDSPETEDNPHLPFVLGEAARAVSALRAEGRTVLLHCVQAHSRTPTVAALYGSLITGVPPAQLLDDILAALPGAAPNPAFRAFLRGCQA